MFGRVLGLEESDITTVSVRPGVVETDMQRLVRTEGAKTMTPTQHAKFTNLHLNKEVLHPDQPGEVLAALAVNAEKSLSGKSFVWNSEELAAYRS
ncbi:hypothetical protein BG004_005615 [Podila humilis]|nr:hypothetical protein BG004_005615 [Podila humilis]